MRPPSAASPPEHPDGPRRQLLDRVSPSNEPHAFGTVHSDTPRGLCAIADGPLRTVLFLYYTRRTRAEIRFSATSHNARPSLMPQARWEQIEAALDEILALPEPQWGAACARIADGNEGLHREVASLLACMGGTDPILDRPLTEPIGVAEG